MNHETENSGYEDYLLHEAYCRGKREARADLDDLENSEENEISTPESQRGSEKTDFIVRVRVRGGYTDYLPDDTFGEAFAKAKEVKKDHPDKDVLIMERKKVKTVSEKLVAAVPPQDRDKEPEKDEEKTIFDEKSSFMNGMTKILVDLFTQAVDEAMEEAKKVIARREQVKNFKRVKYGQFSLGKKGEIHETGTTRFRVRYTTEETSDPTTAALKAYDDLIREKSEQAHREIRDATQWEERRK